MNRILVTFVVVLGLAGCGAPMPTKPDAVRQAERFMSLGVQAFAASDYQGATAMFGKAQAVYRSVDNTEGLVLSGINLAETAIAIGSFDRAERQIQAAEALARTSRIERHRHRLGLLSATVHLAKGESVEAVSRLAQFLPAFAPDGSSLGKRPDGDVLAAIVLRTRIAFGDKDRGDGEDALWVRRLERAIARSGAAQPLVTARLLRFQGQLAARRGDRATARRAFDEALNTYRAQANRPGTAATLGELAQLSVEDRDWKRAEDYLARALFIQLWILDSPGASQSLQALAMVQSAAGDTQTASAADYWATVARERELNWRELREQLTLPN